MAPGDVIGGSGMNARREEQFVSIARVVVYASFLLVPIMAVASAVMS
ncbi:MAG TPA: hypothetical protein QGI71_08845 [Dehalococcoidia bacterium]|jgi:hypothetical protein|nr:hypothetical protein [Dehalococcoidia bacterium]